MSGWFKVDRDVFDSPWWGNEPYTRREAWFFLLSAAAYTDTTLTIRGITIDIKRGQIAWSEDALAAKFRWSRGKIRRYLSSLVRVGKIVQQKTPVNTLLTIVCESDAPENGTTDGTTDGTTNGTTNGTTDGTHIRSKEVKKDKKDKKKKENPPAGTIPFDNFWEAYTKRTNKKAATAAWEKLTDDKRQAAIAGAASFCAGKEAKYIAHPTTYLNGERWTDEEPQPEMPEGHEHDLGTDPKVLEDLEVWHILKRAQEEKERHAAG